MPKKIKKNAQQKDDSEENLSDDLQAETDQGVMKYLFYYISLAPDLMYQPFQQRDYYQNAPGAVWYLISVLGAF